MKKREPACRYCEKTVEDGAELRSLGTPEGTGVEEMWVCGMCALLLSASEHHLVQTVADHLRYFADGLERSVRYEAGMIFAERVAVAKRKRKVKK